LRRRGRVPAGAVAQHGVEDHQELAHGGDQSGLYRQRPGAGRRRGSPDCGGWQPLTGSTGAGPRRLGPSTAMESVQRTTAQPPSMQRWPRRLPESCAIGASPAADPGTACLRPASRSGSHLRHRQTDSCAPANGQRSVIKRTGSERAVRRVPAVGSI
jgi:hypothetical protein